MKLKPTLLLLLGASLIPATAQTTAPPADGSTAPPVPPVTPATGATPAAPIVPATPAIPAETPAQPGTAPKGPGPAPAGQPAVAQSEEGYRLTDAALNDIFQFLAKQAGKQYFHNQKLNTQEYKVTGHLNEGNALQQMEELAFGYNLTLFTKGNTIYALTASQLAQLPSAEWNYQLKYLRPTDIEQIKELIRPVLSPGTGIVNYEPKTNTVVIIDTAQKIEAARELLHKVDQTRGQIVVETKIFRVNSQVGEKAGVDWSSALGTGTSVGFNADLNSLFGINTGLPGSGGESIILDPLSMNGVLRALNTGTIAKQVSNPVLITEDNEQASISFIDRVPIVTATVNNNGNSGVTITEEVRYRIDESDTTIDKDPLKHREIGVTMLVTPTKLPDGTIRMRLRPRSAEITGFKRGQGTSSSDFTFEGNEYPIVKESMVESLARVPDGHSLLLGGFYQEIDKKDKNKVPVLGDIPVLNFFFKSKNNAKDHTSLVFCVTPKSYDARSKSQNSERRATIKRHLSLPGDHDWVDDRNPGPAHEPNICRGKRDLIPYQAPYYPEVKEIEDSGNYPARTK